MNIGAEMLDSMQRRGDRNAIVNRRGRATTFSQLAEGTRMAARAASEAGARDQWLAVRIPRTPSQASGPQTQTRRLDSHKTERRGTQPRDGVPVVTASVRTDDLDATAETGLRH